MDLQLALPLSPQMLAWLLQALGYSPTATKSLKVSAGTLKNARKGEPIPRVWSDLVNSMAALLGASPDQARDQLEPLLSRWDRGVGELPPAGALSVAERAHPLLVRAIPELGLRLGALVGWVAVKTRTQVAQWLWLTQPLDPRFFGKVLTALFTYRLQYTTIESKRTALETHTKVNWRTYERWVAGDAAIPNASHLESLATLFGPHSEGLLRAARAACTLRVDLQQWIGEESAEEWRWAVEQIGRSAALFLSDREKISELLRWIRESLRGPYGDDLLAMTRGMLPNELRASTSSEMCQRIDSAADALLAAEGVIDNSLVAWAIKLTMLAPNPRLCAAVCGGIGVIQSLDFFRLTSTHLHLSSLMKELCTKPTISFKRGDGQLISIDVPDWARDSARQWQVTSLRFRSTEAATEGVEPETMLLALFGARTRQSALGEGLPQALEALEAFVDPAVARVLPDEVVAQSRMFSLERARAFAERGEVPAAFEWVGRAIHVPGPMSGEEIERLMEVLARIPHKSLDDCRSMRRARRALPPPTDLLELDKVLRSTATLADQVVSLIMGLGRSSESKTTALAALVAAIPLALRSGFLHAELASEEARDVEPPRLAADALIEILHVYLKQRPAYGRGWALIAVWRGIHERRTQSEEEKRAIHLGEKQFLAEVRERLKQDLF